MNTESTYYETLMNRYFTGEASGEELSALWAWLDEHPQHKELFKEQKRVYDAIAEEMIESKVNLDSEWEQIRQRLDGTEHTGRKVSMNTMQGNRSTKMLIRVAAGLILLLSVGFLLRQIIFGSDSKVELVASNDVLYKVLPDGSSISLNQGSTLIYPEEFSNGKREVELRGEAHFKVEHDASNPFIVTAGNLQVEVLGTSFYVNTQAAGGKTQVILLEGSVAVYEKDHPDERTILKPGEELLYEPQKKTVSTRQQYEEYFMVWKTRSMKFENERLDRVVNTISRAYNEKITLSDPAIGNCRLTVAFEGQTLESVLTVLESTLDVTVIKSSNGIVISGKGCQ